MTSCHCSRKDRFSWYSCRRRVLCCLLFASASRSRGNSNSLRTLDNSAIRPISLPLDKSTPHELTSGSRLSSQGQLPSPALRGDSSPSFSAQYQLTHAGTVYFSLAFKKTHIFSLSAEEFSSFFLCSCSITPLQTIPSYTNKPSTCNSSTLRDILHPKVSSILCNHEFCSFGPGHSPRQRQTHQL